MRISFKPSKRKRALRPAFGLTNFQNVVLPAESYISKEETSEGIVETYDRITVV